MKQDVRPITFRGEFLITLLVVVILFVLWRPGAPVRVPPPHNLWTIATEGDIR